MSLVSRTIVGAGIALAVTSILMPQSAPDTGASSAATAVESDARAATPAEPRSTNTDRNRLERTEFGGRDGQRRPSRAEVLRGLVSLQLLQSR